jgi:uncharacterized protein (DUF488 family)
VSSEVVEVLTIGHSTHSRELFLALLQRAHVSALADIRSVPHSRHLTHFNRDELKQTLREAGIKYVFLGKELGGRPVDPQMYCNGVADYEKMAAAPQFQNGLERVIGGARKYRIALMCSEHDPLDCHRCLLVGRALLARGVHVQHVLSDGQIINQTQIEHRLLELAGREADDLLASRDERLALAYQDRARRVAFAEPSDNHVAAE